MNIVDLGLVYEVDPRENSTNVKMSLTAPGCPSSGAISSDVQTKLEAAGFPTPKVEIVWDPPWTPNASPKRAKKPSACKTDAIPPYDRPFSPQRRNGRGSGPVPEVQIAARSLAKLRAWGDRTSCLSPEPAAMGACP